jgi:tricorn protease
MRHVSFQRTLPLLAAILWAGSAFAQLDARMMRTPDVSTTRIVFTYAGDLWLVPKEGGLATRLSSPRGEELHPQFSPDGNSIAFSANYDGNTDVYVIPTSGGTPRRVTAHGYPDRVVGWTPDGSRVVFASAMASGRQRYNQFFSVPPTGGLPESLPLPYAETGSLSPDGKKVAYTYITQAFRTWKRYRGGWSADVHIFDLQKDTDENITNNVAGDEFPMWHGNRIYFISDRGPELRWNIWVYDLATKQTRQVTTFADKDIHFPSLGPSDIVFEAGGKLYLLDLATEKPREVSVKVVTDDMTLLPRTENASSLISGFSVSPDGKRALFSARGEVFSVPAENGPVYNLTRSSAFAERYPAWSPDGKLAAYWSDRSGEYELAVYDFERRTEKMLTSYGAGYRYQPLWSPNSKMIAFIDKAMRVKIYDFAKNRTLEVDRANYYYQGGLSAFTVSWSPDSRWLAYHRDLSNRSEAIFIFDTREEKATQVTSGYYPDVQPSFDPDGKYLYFLTNRTLAPVYSDFDNTWIYPNTTNLAAVPLTEDILSPIAPKNDTLSVTAPEVGDKAKKDDAKAAGAKGKEGQTKETAITLSGFEGRAVILPPAAGNITGIRGVAGKVVYLRIPNTGSAEKKRPLMFYDLDKREEKTIVDDVDGFQVSADGKKVLVAKGGAYSIVEVAENQKLDKKMPTSSLEMTVDPRAEWRQLFSDVWRFERDFFYDPNMHGVNWAAQRELYGKLLEAAVTRWDVNYVVGEMISELNASHTYRGGGDLERPVTRPVGYLGIDWALENGAYRITSIVDGAPWDSEVRSPLAMPGLKVKPGDYILAVNGEPMDVKEAPWAAFEGLANKTVELTVNSKPTMEGARTIVVKTLEDEARLRNLAWIESNRKRVEQATGGRVGYIYVPSTGMDGQTELYRQFSAQFMKDGLIIDERFNGGGQIPDRFIELLDRKPLAFYAVRDGMNWQWPPYAHFGPKAMLINGWSGSGGDAFPDHFRKAGLGSLIGTRTWGGLIGMTGIPGLIDGGSVTVPTFRMYNPDGTWFKEGHGVDPDIPVPEDPAKLSKGIDPQLEKAIEEVMKEIKARPSPYTKQPPYEKR